MLQSTLALTISSSPLFPSRDATADAATRLLSIKTYINAMKPPSDNYE